MLSRKRKIGCKAPVSDFTKLYVREAARPSSKVVQDETPICDSVYRCENVKGANVFSMPQSVESALQPSKKT